MMDCEKHIWPALKSSLRSSTSIVEEGDECKVTVPFEKFDNDAISLKISRQGDEFVITDESETYGMLYLSNVKIDQPRRQRRLKSTKQRYNLDAAEYEIRLTATKENLGDRIFDAIQAVQSVSSLALTRQQYTTSDFHDEVGSQLTEWGHYYERNVKVGGVVEDHRIDFHVQNGKPIYLQALHAENAPSAYSMAVRTQWKWTDIVKEIPDCYRISVLDDETGEIDDRAVAILKDYSDAYIPWSSRQQLQTTLAQA